MTSTTSPILTATLYAAPAASPTPAADVVISAGQANQVIVLGTGQIINIELPGKDLGWQIDYSESILQALTSPEKMRAPGSQGWFFRVIAAGETQIILTSIPVCSQPDPCPLMPVRLVFNIQVK